MRNVLTLSILLICTCSFSVRAAIVSYEFRGKVERLSTTLNSELSTVFSVGDPVRVTVDMDDVTVDADGGDPTRGDYSAGVAALNFSIGNYTGSAQLPVRFQLGNGFSDGRDFVEIVASNVLADPLGARAPDEFRIQLRNLAGTALSSNALPTPPINPFAFDDNISFTFMSLTFDRNGLVRSPAVSIEFSPVPVPPALALLGGALIALRLLRRFGSSYHHAR